MRQVDFIFLIDGTLSMQPCMDSLKANINVFLDELMGEQSVLRDWRGKVVTYRDEKETEKNGSKTTLLFTTMGRLSNPNLTRCRLEEGATNRLRSWTRSTK